MGIYSILIALPCAAGAMALAMRHIYRHLLNYTEPIYQRYMVRIIFMVPVYALTSFLSLIFNKSSIYFDSIREVTNIIQTWHWPSWNPVYVPKDAWNNFSSQNYAINVLNRGYEAWVIYNFLSLCLAWVGGPGAVVLSLSGQVLKPSWCLMTCCFPAVPLDGRFIRRCKQGALQFVILKPILVLITFVFYAKGKYEDGNFSADQAYLYITIIYTISYSVALYALALFYVACRDLLRPFNPVPKFIMIKSVVFLTYWQGVLVFLAAKSGFIKNAEEAADFQNFILCIEMLVAAVGHLYAFPYKEYAGADIGASGGLLGSLAHALKFNDVYHDTVHQFAPTYHDYVLYSNNECDEEARPYQTRTLGQGMEAFPGNNHMVGDKIDDIELSIVSSSGSSSPKISSAHDLTNPEAIKSSSLNESTSVTVS